ncbi:MAG: type II toxin-antitoxin system Phd/YefM family antitoxin [Candidatus Eremiobacteraeota bacterium]|nr:type II toxin-antitoxin system Phd/YefM family antitoxin [Candidatus Eremiobacteraeota bacterium]
MTTSKVNVANFKAHVSTYLGRVQAGETVTVCRRNVPIAELRPVAEPAPKKRVFRNLHPGWQIPDSFFDPLPDEILDAFERRDPNDPSRDLMESDP